jgi:hypothetical protein
MIDFDPARALLQSNSRRRVAAALDMPFSRERRALAGSSSQFPAHGNK